MSPAVQKLPLILVALAAVLGAAFVLYKQPPAPTPIPMDTLKIISLSVGTATVVAEVADTAEQQQRGMGGRASLEEGRGMWFAFNTDEFWPFWMKDTLIPLDIIWVASDGTIVTIATGVEPGSYPQVFAPTALARFVLEVPAGFAARHGIAEGDKVLQN